MSVYWQRFSRSSSGLPGIEPGANLIDEGGELIGGETIELGEDGGGVRRSGGDAAGGVEGLGDVALEEGRAAVVGLGQPVAFLATARARASSWARKTSTGLGPTRRPVVVLRNDSTVEGRVTEASDIVGGVCQIGLFGGFPVGLDRMRVEDLGGFGGVRGGQSWQVPC